MFKPLKDGIYTAEFPVRIPEGSYIQGFVFRWNPCCPDRPVVIVGCSDDNIAVRSIAQCACGLWHTPEFNSESAALREYENMVSTHEKIKCWEKQAAEKVGDQSDVGNN